MTSSSNHREKLLWSCSSASVLLLFLRHRISGFRCSLTSGHVWSVLIKSNMQGLWPLNVNQIKCLGNKWEILEGWVHVGRYGSRGAYWAPSFFASSDFIDLNLMKSSVLITERHGEDGRVKQANNSYRWRWNRGRTKTVLGQWNHDHLHDPGRQS